MTDQVPVRPAPGVRIDAPRRDYSAISMLRTGETVAAIEKAYILECGKENHHEAVSKRLSSTEELRASLEEPASSKYRLLVMHGLPEDYLQVLLNLLIADSHFLDAHARRRSYMPLGRMGRDENVGFAHFDYPELVNCGTESVEPYVDKVDDLMGEPTVHPLSSFDDTAAIFSRASLWMSSSIDGIRRQPFYYRAAN